MSYFYSFLSFFYGIFLCIYTYVSFFILVGVDFVRSNDCYYKEEKQFVIVIPSYNNSKWYKKNLDSAVFQDYTNYRIIYVDDCSPDGTGDLVEQYIKENNLYNKIKLLRNKVRRGAMANWYYTIHNYCDDGEIIVTVDGDDWLAHDKVLKRLNQEYVSPYVWLTYGSYREWPTGRLGICREFPFYVISNRSFRHYAVTASHLRTFYAWLFKQINREDFLRNGEFLTVTCDLAIMFPILEMAGNRFRFIPDILYIYNVANPINDFRTQCRFQLEIEGYIRRKPCYAYLDKSFIID